MSVKKKFYPGLFSKLAGILISMGVYPSKLDDRIGLKAARFSKIKNGYGLPYLHEFEALVGEMGGEIIVRVNEEEFNIDDFDELNDLL